MLLDRVLLENDENQMLHSPRSSAVNSSQIRSLKACPAASNNIDRSFGTSSQERYQEKQFELALTLTNVCENKLDDKVKRMQEIRILYGFDLFCNMKFKEALDLFLKLDVDVSHVIGLYSDLFPSEFRNQIEYPGKVPIFTGPDLEKGYTALVEYLTEVRHKLEGNIYV